MGGFTFGFLGSIIGFLLTLILAVGASYVIGAAISIKTGIEYGWQIVVFIGLGIVLSYAVAILLARYPFDKIHFIRLFTGLAALALVILITYKRLYEAKE